MRASDIAGLLPWVYQRTLVPGSPLDAMLASMEGLQAPADGALASLDRYFDPRRAPDGFVPYLARWLALDWVLVRPAEHYYAPGGTDEPIQSGVGRLRELVAAATFLAQRRGTASGIVRFLELATGVSGFAVDERVPGRPFFVAFTMPKAAQPYETMVRTIIEAEKPAYLEYELQVASG
jgi:phage tail-like protein